MKRSQVVKRLKCELELLREGTPGQNQHENGKPWRAGARASIEWTLTLLNQECE